MRLPRLRPVAALLAIGTLSVLPSALSTPASAATPGQVVITEWMYNPLQSAPVGSEFVEITNIGGASVDLATYSFDDDSRTPGAFPLAGLGSLAPGESALITETPATTFRADWGLAAGVKVAGSNSQNLGRNDEINIFVGTTLADRLTYGDQNIAGTIRTQGRSGAPSSCGALGANTVGAWSFTTAGVAGATTSASGDVGSPGTSPLNACGPVTIVGGGGSGSTVPCQPEAASGTGPATAGAQPWPGAATVAVADQLCAWKTATGPEGRDMSGLVFDPSDPSVLWGVKNKSWVFRLVQQSGAWVPDTTGDWGGGKQITFPGGTGQPDSEGMTVGGDGALYVTTERDNAANTFALNSILRFDPTASGTTLQPTQQWDLTADFPELIVPGGNKDKANLGFEGVTFVPDSYLVDGGFVDQSTGAAYDPADYPTHGSGLFFAALENDGKLYAYALGTDGSHHRVAVVDTGMGHVMEVQYDADLERIWAVCDNTCGVTSTVLTIDPAGALVPDARFARPADAAAGLPNVNVEGFAIAPDATCASGTKQVVWADDGLSATGNLGHALYRGTLPCDLDLGSAPATTIDSAPSGSTPATSASVAFSGSDNLTVPGALAFECSIDGGAFAACTSPLSLADLAFGPHSVAVRSTDQAGNQDPTPATASWTVVGPIAPGASVHDVTVLEGSAGTTVVEVPVTLSWPSTSPVTVTLDTTPGSAAEGDDFAPAGAELTFAPGETSKTLEIDVVGDQRFEPSEKFSVGLTSPVGATVADASAIVTLIDDDDPLSVVVSDPAVVEGASGTTDLSFDVSLTGPVPAGASASVTVATANGSATAGSDYEAIAPTVLTFAPGETSKSVTVTVQGDAAAEKNETLSLKLTAPVDVWIADTLGTGTIVNDDGPKPVAMPLPTLAIGETVVLEGDAGTSTAVVPVTLSQPSATPVTVQYATAPGTAIAPGDFTAVPTTLLTFAPGETSKAVEVEVAGDQVPEAREKLAVQLRTPVGATLADTAASVHVLDQDPALRIEVSDAAAVEGTGATGGVLHFQVRLSAPVPAGGSVSVDVSRAHGTAVADADFEALGTSTLTFGPGEQTKTVTVRLVGDAVRERNETLWLKATNAVGATLSDANGLGTVVDDD